MSSRVLVRYKSCVACRAATILLLAPSWVLSVGSPELYTVVSAVVILVVLELLTVNILTNRDFYPASDSAHYVHTALDRMIRTDYTA